MAIDGETGAGRPSKGGPGGWAAGQGGRCLGPAANHDAVAVPEEVAGEGKAETLRSAGDDDALGGGRPWTPTNGKGRHQGGGGEPGRASPTQGRVAA